MAYSPAGASFLDAWAAGDPDRPQGGEAPLILTTGTLRARVSEAGSRAWETFKQTKREALFGHFRDVHCRAVLTLGQGLRTEHWDCARDAWPRCSRCAHCGAKRIAWEGRCGRADCPLCFRRYPARRARRWRFRLGPAEHFWYVVLTVPPGLRTCHSAEWFRVKAKQLARAIETLAYPLIPAGLLALHVAGDEDPFREHPHYNLIVSSRAWKPDKGPCGADSGTLVRCTTPTLGQEEMRALHVRAAELGFGWSADMVQCHQSFNRSHKEVAHNIRYTLRDQSFGDLVALLKWHKPHQQLVRGLGMCATGRVGTWIRVNPWQNQEHLDEALGRDLLAWEGEEPCESCGPSTPETERWT